MAYGIALKMREIRVHPVMLDDDDYMTNARTGEVYAHNRSYRREERALGSKISKHEAQRRKPLGLRRARRNRRKMSQASRRRNR